MTLVVAGALYALFTLDHFMVGPLLLSRPLIAGATVGTVLGHPREGVLVGLLGESVWALVPPGGPRQWDAGLVTVLSLVWNVSPGEGAAPMPLWSLAGATLVALPYAGLGRWIDQRFRVWTHFFVDDALRGLERGSEGPLKRSLLVTAVLWVFKSALVFGVGALGGGVLWRWLVPHLTEALRRGLDRSWSLWAALGVAVVTHQFLERFRHRGGRLGGGL